MAKNDSDLFDRLRRAGLRKEVARTLSEIGEGAGKKLQGTARGAAAELRSLADEIERRLPDVAPSATSPRTTPTAKPRGTAATPAAKPAPRAPRTPRTATKPAAGAATAKTRASRAPAGRSSPAAKPATRRSAPSGRQGGTTDGPGTTG